MGQETRGGEGHEGLDAWKLSDDLAVSLFHATRKLPSDMRWLSSQVLRAATSVPANIAEGYARASKREFLQFLSVSRASLAEVEYFIHFMKRTGLLKAEEHGKLSDQRRAAAQRLHGLIKYVRQQVRDAGKQSDAVYEPRVEYVTDDEA